MEIVKGTTRFELYDSIKEMPAGRLTAFQVHLVQHNALGSTFEELDARFERLDTFLAAGRVEDARRERENMRMGFWLMFEGINSMSVCLANLVKAIDGVPVSVRTDDDMRRVAALLEATDLTQEEIEGAVEAVKKK